MEIKTNFTDNQIPDQYGDNIDDSKKRLGINQLSFPFEVIDIPTGTKTIAGSLMDYDTIPLFGFPWIHWTFGDIPVTGNQLDFPIDASRQGMINGENSLHSMIQNVRMPTWKLNKEHRELETHYAGPRPRSGVHNYRLSIFALDDSLNLQPGFTLNELMNQLDTHLLAQTAKNLTYQRK